MYLSTFTVYLISFILTYLVIKLFNKFKLNCNKSDAKFNLPPCLPYLPIVGSLPFISDPKRFYVFFMKKSKVLGNVIAFYLGNRYHVILNGRKTIQEALAKKAINFASRPEFYLRNFHNPSQKGIIEHPYNEDFKVYHRACLNVLKKFGFGQEAMEMKIQCEIDYFVRTVKLKKGQPFNPSKDVTTLFFNIVGGVLYGTRGCENDPQFKKLKKIIRIFTQGFILRFYLALRFIPHFIGHVKVISAAIQTWEQFIESKKNSILYDDSLKTFSKLFNEELKTTSTEIGEGKHVDEEFHKMLNRDLTLGGTETSSTTILWFIYLIANHQNVQKEIKDELDRVVGADRLPSMKDKSNLPITEATVLELMRIRTLAPTAIPHMTLEDSVIDGVYIPGGTIVIANLYSAHMDPDVWDKPEEFRIERFLNADRNKVVNQHLIIPFSLGKRSCIGEPLARQQVFLMASALIQKFHILPPEGQTEVVAEEVVGATVCPSPFEVRFIERV